MQVADVKVVGAKTFETVLDRALDGGPRKPWGLVPGLHADFTCQDNSGTAWAKQVAEQPLRIAARVNVCRIDEVYPRVKRAIENPAGRFTIRLASKAHGAKARPRHVQAGMAQGPKFHIGLQVELEIASMKSITK
jgi:hypothetical protein